MALPVELALAAVALVGHFSIAVWGFNRLQSLSFRRRIVKALERIFLAMMAGLVLAFAFRWLVSGSPLFVGGFWFGYAACTWLAAAAVIPYWLIPKLLERTPAALLSNDTTTVDVTQRLGYQPIHGFETQLLARLPRNEILQLAIQRKTLQLPSLPRELAGLTIGHLTDLHMTGQLGREFYDVVVDETNAFEPDLVVITGDILEKERCLPWIEATLGRLQARYGKYFIIGNHEQRLPDVGRLRSALTAAGLTDLGSRCEVLEINGAKLLIAGTELPWFGSAPIHPSSFIPHASSFRLLLSHTPDQLPWARAQGYDLMLAGHNHGGQIRFPVVGALITPSRYGSRYAGGLYDESPTLLHVSRGLAGVHAIRWNCPPELALLKLVPASLPQI